MQVIESFLTGLAAPWHTSVIVASGHTPSQDLKSNGALVHVARTAARHELLYLRSAPRALSV